MSAEFRSHNRPFRCSSSIARLVIRPLIDPSRRYQPGSQAPNRGIPHGLAHFFLISRDQAERCPWQVLVGLPDVTHPRRHAASLDVTPKAVRRVRFSTRIPLRRRDRAAA